MEKNNYIVAVDLGTSKVTVAAASKDPDGRLNIIDLISKPMEGMERGEVTNIEQVTAATRDALGELEENLGINVTSAYTGISGENIRCGSSSYFVHITGPDGEIRDEDVAKLHESMNTQPAPEGYYILDRIPQSYVIDGREKTMKPVGRFGKRLESTFNFILGNRNSVERLNKAMNRLHVKPLGIFSNAQASSAAVLTDDEKELGVAVVDIGAGCTDISIWFNNIMRYVSVLPIGSTAINGDIRSMAIRDRVIEKLKITHGYATVDAIPEDTANQTIVIKGTAKRDDKTISYRALTQIIEARLLDIVEYVMAEIKDAGYADKLGAGIVLTGGGAKMRGIDMLFREKTKYDVRIAGADPMIVNSLSEDAAADMANSTVIGLLLMGAADSRMASTATPIHKRDKNSPAWEDNAKADPEPEVEPKKQEEPVKSRHEKEDNRSEKGSWWSRRKNRKQEDQPRKEKATSNTSDKEKEGWFDRIKKEVFDVEIIDDEDDQIS